MKLDAAGLTDVGLRRENNQDSYLIEPDLGLYVVADGMGGHLGGEVASRLAVETVHSVIKDTLAKDKNWRAPDLLQRSYQEACRVIYNQSKANSELKGMGTTMVVALAQDDKIYVGNVGDSRAYLVRAPYIWQITDDHSLLNEQIRSGVVTPENIGQFAAKNVITRSVGFEEKVECDVIERRLGGDEMILICSDGLSGMVPDQRLCDICLSVPFGDVAPTLVEEAKKAGGEDNVTALIIKKRAQES